VVSKWPRYGQNSGDTRYRKCSTYGHIQSECRSKPNDRGLICQCCNKAGHRSPECRSIISQTPRRTNFVAHQDRECYLCHKTGHIARDCSKYQTASAAIGYSEKQNDTITERPPIHKGNACIPIGAHSVHSNDHTDCECVGDSEVKLACGKRLPIISGACRVVSDNLPITKGLVGDVMVDVLRDTGCSGVVVSRSMINDDQLLNKTERCMLIDGSILKVPMAKIDIDTPYFTGKAIEAMVMKSPLYDLVVGNIPGARRFDNPIKDWRPRVARDIDQTKSVGMTRAGATRDSKPLKRLKVTQLDMSNIVDVKDLVKLQNDHKSMHKIRR